MLGNALTGGTEEEPKDQVKKKKKYYPKDASKEDVKLAKPNWADKQDYKVLVDYWFDSKTVVSIFSCSIIFYW